jgi:predicted RNase H-like HicB family nuclease
MASKLILVRAFWDDEAGVWVATSDDVPGLATEADTIEQVRVKLLVMIPELLEANNVCSDLPEIPVHIMAEQTARIPNPRA